MKLFSIILSLCILGIVDFPSNLYAQAGSADISPSDLRDIAVTNRVPVRNFVHTEGSPFLYDEFYEGRITLFNRRTTRTMPIRYNSYEQSIEFMDNNSAYAIGGEGVLWFEFKTDDGVYTFRRGFDSRRLSPYDFVQVLADGEITFLVRHSTSFHQSRATYGTATRQDRFVSSKTYFIKAGNESPDRIRSLSERRVMRYINFFEDEVEAFADQQNIDFSSPADVTKLLKYYNSLLDGQ